ncbi:MAG: hypothetical protein ACPH4H_07190, partial [Candidatus Poseidoniaceae archaeon]
ETGVLYNSMILFDVMLLAGPLGISVMLDRKGLNDDSLNRTADIVTMMGLLILGLFDTTGGLLFVAMYALVFSRALKHRLNFILCIAPLALILYAQRFVSDGAIMAEVLSIFNFVAYNPTETTVGDLSRFTFIIMTFTNFIILVRAVIDRRTNEYIEFESPVAIPAFWLTFGIFGVLPEASWLLLSMTVLLTVYSWLIGKLDLIPWTPVMAFFSFYIGFTNDPNFNRFDDIDYLTNSLLGTGLFTLCINQASATKFLYKYADEVDSSNSIEGMAFSVFNLDSIEARERLTDIMRTWTIICLTFSWTALKGIGTVIGAIWATYDSIVNGQKYALLALPLLHAFAIWNVMEQLNVADGTQDLFVGGVLMVAGIAMTIISSKPETAWNWKIYDWGDEIEYYGWIDRVGQLGIVYFLTGITWAIGEADLDQFLWAVWAAYLSGIAVQGFRDETETPWRRGFGSMGSIFSLFMLSLTFDTELYTYVTWMFLGVVALGFGFAYISRMGEVSTIYTEDYTEVKEAIIEQQRGGGLAQIDAIPEPVLTDDEEEEEVEVIEESVEAEDYYEDEIEDEDFDFSELDDEEEETDVSESLQQKKDVKKEKSTLEIPKPVTSAFDYDLILDPTISQAIQNSLANTPHEGFKPVVSVSQNGSLKIDFVPI